MLLCLARDPEIRLRDIADRIGITERAGHAIVSDLEKAGYIAKSRIGRRNRYEVRWHMPLRHPVEGTGEVATLLSLFDQSPKRMGEPG